MKDRYQLVRHHARIPISHNSALLIAALIPLSFFYFNTQMHDRYSHPALIFIITYSILNRKWILPILACSAYLLNLDRALHGWKIISYETLVYEPVFISLLFAICIVYMMYLLYLENSTKHDLSVKFDR